MFKAAKKSLLGSLAIGFSLQAFALDILYTANRQGEVEPCGCQVNQIGGLDRMDGYLRSLKGPRLILDSGDSFFSSAVLPDVKKETESARAEVVAEAYRLMHVDFYTPGERDLSQGLEKLQNLIERAQVKTVSANLFRSDGAPAFLKWSEITFGGQKFIVTGVSPLDLGVKSPFVAKNPEDALKEVWSETKSIEAQKIILSHLGIQKDRELAQKFDGVWIFGSHSMDVLEKPERHGKSLIFQPQLEGQQIGHLSVSDTVSGEWTHRLVDLEKHWEKEGPVRDLLVKYRKAPKKVTGKALAAVPGKTKPYVANPHLCKSCHEEQHAFWEGTKHSSAILVLYAKNQHFDPDCIGCHTLGYSEPGGFSKISEPIVLEKKAQSKIKKGMPFVETLLTHVFRGDAGGALDSRMDPERHGKLHASYTREINSLYNAKTISKNHLGIQCEHCHGNREDHWKAMTTGKSPTSPFKVSLETCRTCHRAPNAPDFDPASIVKVACPLMKRGKG